MSKFKLRPEEEASLNLRKLYADYDYDFYRMSRFEEYDFYADKKDFLISKNILTFTDADGKLMALRPDVTLSIIKHIRNIDNVNKFFYDERIYRVPRNSDSFHEFSQTGIECIGSLNDDNLCEVIELAVKSLHELSKGRRYLLDISHAGLIASLVHENRTEILKCLSEKNIHGLKNINAPKEIIRLAEINNDVEEALRIIKNVTGSKVLDLLSGLKKYHDFINIDFSVVNNLNYYNGIIFRGFIEGINGNILSGGQYDNLMSLMGHKGAKGIGFAVSLDLLGVNEND